MRTKTRSAKSALKQLYNGVVQPRRPLLFLDFDDVICLNDPYGGFDVFQPTHEHPADLWDKLFAEEPKRLLLHIAREFEPHVVLTTSWLRLMERPGFESLFRRTGLSALVPMLHEQWEAPQARGANRWQAIETWLAAHYEGQPVVVLDDTLSGTGLAESPLHFTGRVVLCEVGVGLTSSCLDRIRTMLPPGGQGTVSPAPKA